MTMLLKVQQAQFTNVPFPFQPHPSLSTLSVLFQPSPFYAPSHFSYVLYNPSFFYAPPHLPSLPSPCSPSYSIRYLSSLLSHVPLHILSATFHPSPNHTPPHIPSFPFPYSSSNSPPFRSILPHSMIP